MEEPRKDVSPAQPTDASPESASVPPSETPATPAHEEADRVSGQPPVPDGEHGAPENDSAPDADEPGDDVAPEEVEQFSQDQPDQPDEVDQNDANE